MAKIHKKLTKYLVSLKTLKNIRQLSRIPVSLPTPAREVKNVLVILPLEETYLDAAMTLVRHLRQSFPVWHFMILDISKIPADELDKYDLPGPQFMENLKSSDFQLLVDLNFEENLRIKYLVGLLQMPYRLHLHPSDSDYYNMYARINREDFKGYNHVLNYLKSSFLV